MTDEKERRERENPGFGRSRSLSRDEQQRLARQQGELISSGRARKGRIVLNTPARRAVFVGGLVGIFVLALGVTIFA